MSACMDNLVALIDDDLCIGCEAVAAESDYSRLANNTIGCDWKTIA